VQQVDGTGFVWTFLEDARDAATIVAGAIVVTGDEVDPVLARVVAIVQRPGGMKVYLDILPGDPTEYVAALTRGNLVLEP
jgi:hypothetical protein